MFELALFLVAVLSGATAALVGFGIGSLLTPLLASALGTPLAVAAVGIPHAVATCVRAWRLRRDIDWNVMRGFGVLSAVGGLAGALLYSSLGHRGLTIVLGLLLLATASAGLTGWNRSWKPAGPWLSLLGFASGAFGGLAGNQGGLRTAALSAFGLKPLALVATSTAIGVLVDAARTPFYVWRSGAELLALWHWIAIACAGVLAGTFWGERVLRRLPPEVFRWVVHGAIGLLGLGLLASVRT